jgi:hypothetical protein
MNHYDLDQTLKQTRSQRSVSRGGSRWIGVIGLAVAAWAGMGEASPVAAQNGVGLKGLSDDALLAELARRNLGQLLDRVMEEAKTPDELRRALRSRISLNQLEQGDLPPARRDELIRQVVAGLTPDMIARVNDPKTLYEQADLLIQDGIASDINTLEYWGPSPATQARVRPVVETALLLAERAHLISTEQMSKVVVRGPNDQRGYNQFIELENISLDSEQMKQQLAYYRALAMDVADPQRDAIARGAIEYLSPFDREDNPARNFVRIMIGKLQSVRMNPEGFESARKAFGEVIASDGQVPPEAENPDEWLAADLANQFEARFFLTGVEVAAQQPDSAKKAFEQLIAWQKRSQVDSDLKAQWAIANDILEYRMLSVEAQRATSPDLRMNKTDEATRLLLRLIDKRPELTDLILSQLLSTVDPNTPVEKLDILLLKARVGEGEKAVNQREAGQQIDAGALDRAAAAAREIVRRDGQKNIDSKLVESARYREAVFIEAAGRAKDAAHLYLDVAQALSKTNAELAEVALSRGQRLIGILHEESPNSPDIEALLDRVYPLSIASPFNQTQYAFTWGVRQQRQKKFAAAADTFRQIKKDDPNFNESRYWLLRALDSQASPLPAGDPQRNQLLTDANKLIADVRKFLRDRSQSTDDAVRERSRSQLAYVTLLGARISGTVKNDPRETIELLKGFEDEVKGLPDESQLMGDAMFMRVGAFMSLDRVDDAVNALLKLIEQSGGQRGGAIVRGMLERLEAEFEAARSAGDSTRMATLQQNRAALTPRLVEWASLQSGPDSQRQLYIYQRYNAETQRLAADFVSDPADATARREAALKLFLELDAPNGFKQYQLTLPEADRPRARYDTAVALSIARLYHDLGNLDEARNRYGRLAVDRAVGLPVTVRTEGGVEIESDNDAYWETIFRWIDTSKKTAQPTEQFKTYLKEQYVRWGDRVGGSQWKSQFESLRKELIPDFDPKAPATNAPAPASAKTSP